MPPPPSFDKDQQPAAVPIWREALVGLDWLSLRGSPLRYGRGVPRGDGSAVVVIPGFLFSDWYLFELRRWLTRIGYRAEPSRIGRNADCPEVLGGRLLDTVERVRAATARRVHLVGHSLGGTLARSLAARRPELIASVTTLGSPFRGIRAHPLVLRASKRVHAEVIGRRGATTREGCFTGYCPCDAVAGLQLPFPTSVSQRAVYTRRDGIVDWRSCVNDDPRTDVEVTGTHLGLVVNPAVYRLLAAHLADARREAVTAEPPR
jgi:pimeloyl-ACP methyl ester carboxylesterase